MLTGSIPASLANLKRIERLFLQNNKLQGEIPSELGGVISLERLQLHSNELTGSVPTELGGFLGLQILTLHDNALTGSMPSEICALTDSGPIDNLEVLESDCLTGDILCDLDCCSRCW